MWLPLTACMVSQLWFLYCFWEQYYLESLLDLLSSSSLCIHYASCNFDKLFCNCSVISCHDSLKIQSSLRLGTLPFILFYFLYLWHILPFPNIFSSSISPQLVRTHTHTHTHTHTRCTPCTENDFSRLHYWPKILEKLIDSFSLHWMDLTFYF